ncbi:MAG: EAL domain-containing protein, partial [Gammaproteobacteria bacterium]|nr:EAL domain-containing protein [Gammaproteobacteria bacterium]
ELGLVSPEKFIPIAESSGMVIAIGEWVLMESCRQAKSWIDAGKPLKMISVNVSGQQIMHSDVVETVQKTLQKTGLEPQYLELEITESVIMKQPEKAIGTLEKLRALGVSLAIDDFGTGYSSLSYLKLFPINRLKIDRSFIKDIPVDSDDVAIVKAIIALGKSLKLKVIAEGVETEAQQKALKQYGCDEVQGFLYSKPIPADEFELLY